MMTDKPLTRSECEELLSKEMDLSTYLHPYDMVKRLARDLMAAMGRIWVAHESDCPCEKLKVYCETAEFLRHWHEEKK